MHALPSGPFGGASYADQRSLPLQTLVATWLQPSIKFEVERRRDGTYLHRGGLRHGRAMDLASAFGSDDGRGRPPARKAERSIFDPPESREELIEDGQRAAEWVSSSIAWLRTEGADALQGALVLGTVAAVFPRFADALHEAGLGHADVSGVWVVWR